MNNYTSFLEGRNVVMISDTVLDDYDEEDRQEEKELLDGVKKELSKKNIKFHFIEVPSLRELKKELSSLDKDKIVIFNWCEEVEGKPNSGNEVVEFLEKEGYVYTGADTQTFAKAANRHELKKILNNNKIGTPKAKLIQTEKDLADINFFPVLLKSTVDHGSFEIRDSSIKENAKQLKKAYYQLTTKTGKVFFAEQYIHGREFILSVWGNTQPEVLPIFEVVFNTKHNDKYQIMNYESKWDKSSPDYKGIYVKPAYGLNKNLETNLKNLAFQAYTAIDAAGFARLEVRVDANDNAYIIDFNPNPNFRPNTSFVMAAQLAGYNYGSIVLKMCENALERSHVTV